MTILGLVLIGAGVIALIMMRNTFGKYKNQNSQSSDTARRQRLGLKSHSNTQHTRKNPPTAVSDDSSSALSADMVMRLEPAKQLRHKSPNHLKLQVFFAGISMILLIVFYLLWTLLTFLGVYD